MTSEEEAWDPKTTIIPDGPYFTYSEKAYAYFTKGGREDLMPLPSDTTKDFAILTLDALGLLDTSAKVSICAGCYLEGEIIPPVIASYMTGRCNAAVLLNDVTKGEHAIKKTIKNTRSAILDAVEAYTEWNPVAKDFTVVQNVSLVGKESAHRNVIILRFDTLTKGYTGVLYEPHGNEGSWYAGTSEFFEKVLSMVDVALEGKYSRIPVMGGEPIPKVGAQGADDVYGLIVSPDFSDADPSDVVVQGMCTSHSTIMLLLACLYPTTSIYSIEMSLILSFIDIVQQKPDVVAIQATKKGMKHMAQVFSLNMAKSAATVAKKPSDHLCCVVRAERKVVYDGSSSFIE
jgi:hypothetical protein